MANTDAYLNSLFAPPPPVRGGLFSSLAPPPPTRPREDYVMLTISLCVAGILYSLVNQMMSYAAMAASVAVVYFLYEQRMRLQASEQHQYQEPVDNSQIDNSAATQSGTNNNDDFERRVISEIVRKKSIKQSEDGGNRYNYRPSVGETMAVDMLESAMKDKQMQKMAAETLTAATPFLKEAFDKNIKQAKQKSNSSQNQRNR